MFFGRGVFSVFLAYIWSRYLGSRVSEGARYGGAYWWSVCCDRLVWSSGLIVQWAAVDLRREFRFINWVSLGVCTRRREFCERRSDGGSFVFGGSLDEVLFLRNFGLGGSIRERISYPLSFVFQSPSSSIKNRYRHPEYYYYGRQAVFLVWSWTEGLSVHLSVHRWWSLMLSSLSYSSVPWFLNIIQPHWIIFTTLVFHKMSKRIIFIKVTSNKFLLTFLKQSFLNFNTESSVSVDYIELFFYGFADVLQSILSLRILIGLQLIHSVQLSPTLICLSVFCWPRWFRKYLCAEILALSLRQY